MNDQAHLDIEDEIQKKKNGQLTFILRINNYVIVDLNILEYVSKEVYTELEQEVIKELTIPYIDRQTDRANAVRNTNSSHNNNRRSHRQKDITSSS